MITIQEVSGETLYKLSQEVLSVETSDLWQHTHLVVLKDFVKFNKDYELVFHNRQILHSGETYMAMLKSAQRRYTFKLILEINDYWLDLCPDWKEALQNVLKFVKKHKLGGVKLCLSENLTLNYDHVQAVKCMHSETVGDWFFLLAFHDSLLQYTGFIQHLCHLADYILFPVQGYFDKQYVKVVCGHKFEKLASESDRIISKIEAHVNKWVLHVIPRSKLVAYIATTGVAMEIDIVGNYVFNLYEVARTAIYQRLGGNVDSGEIVEVNEGYGYKVFFDNHAMLKQKIHVLMTTHGFAGVCIQELQHDLLWKDKRSVLGVVTEYLEHASSQSVSLPGDTGGTLQVGTNDQTFLGTSSTIAPRLV